MGMISMKPQNEKPINLSKKIASGNIKTAQETAERLTRPSNLTSIGSVVGITIGSVLILGGLTGYVFGKAGLGAGSLTTGIVAVITNTINLKKRT